MLLTLAGPPVKRRILIEGSGRFAVTSQATAALPADGLSTAAPAPVPSSQAVPFVDYRTEPGRYKHWRLAADGPVATLTLDVDGQGGPAPGYELKLTSDDPGGRIRLQGALQRLRCAAPAVKP